MNTISPTDTELAPRLILIDKYDYIFYAALALLPVDGTVIGIRMPYWSPISPILFLCYVCLNWRLLHTAARPYLGFMLFPITVLLPLSAFAWSTYHFRLITTITTALGILGFLSCLLSLHIAFSIKKLSTSFAASIIGAAYWVAFVVGVIEFLALRLDIHSLRSYFAHLMLRPYNRPQFLFAEPSYIGMHVFGVLLPTYWMTKNKRLRTLVFTFIIGSFLMGSGLRIIIDSTIACVLWSLPHIKFNSRRNRNRRRSVSNSSNSSCAFIQRTCSQHHPSWSHRRRWFYVCSNIPCICSCASLGQRCPAIPHWTRRRQHTHCGQRSFQVRPSKLECHRRKEFVGNQQP